MREELSGVFGGAGRGEHDCVFRPFRDGTSRTERAAAHYRDPITSAE